jgi:RNA polymerase sigma-70 factor, ECF subfamily
LPSVTSDAGTEGRPRRFARKTPRAVSGDELLISRAIARAKEGDRDALSYLYVQYADDIQSYVSSIVRDAHEAEDITQSLFAKLMTAIGKYEERSVPFSAWLLRVARNAALDAIRARRQVPVEEVRASEEGDDRLGYERAQSLKAALEQLPSEQREVLVLRHIAGLSPPEIAKRLDRSEGSIHGLHHRGRSALQDSLRELGSAPVTAFE